MQKYGVEEGLESSLLNIFQQLRHRRANFWKLQLNHIWPSSRPVERCVHHNLLNSAAERIPRLAIPVRISAFRVHDVDCCLKSLSSVNSSHLQKLDALAASAYQCLTRPVLDLTPLHSSELGTKDAHVDHWVLHNNSNTCRILAFQTSILYITVPQVSQISFTQTALC